MVAARNVAGQVQRLQRFAENQSAAAVFHQDDQEQHQRDRAHRRGFMYVLGQTVVGNFGLGDVHQDEKHVDAQRPQIEFMQAEHIARPGGLVLRVGDQEPDRNLVQAVRHPGRKPGPDRRVGQLPVVPPVDRLVGLELDSFAVRTEQDHQADDGCAAEQPPPVPVRKYRLPGCPGSRYRRVSPCCSGSP